MVSLPDGEKNFEDIFIRFGATPERDRQTDGHRVTAKTVLMHMHRAVKICLLGGRLVRSAASSFYFGTLYISVTNGARKLKFGTRVTIYAYKRPV